MKVTGLIALLQTEEMGYISDKKYQVSYVVNNPPLYAREHKEIWERAFREHLKREGLQIGINETVEGIEWGDVVRLYHFLLEKESRPTLQKKWKF